MCRKKKEELLRIEKKMRKQRKDIHIQNMSKEIRGTINNLRQSMEMQMFDNAIGRSLVQW